MSDTEEKAAENVEEESSEEEKAEEKESGSKEEETEAVSEKESEEEPKTDEEIFKDEAAQRAGSTADGEAEAEEAVPEITETDQKVLDAIPDETDEYLTMEDKVLFYKERMCLLLLLESRKLLSAMLTKKEFEDDEEWVNRLRREAEEKKRTGRLSVQEIQDMLQSQPEDDNYDMVSEIQELKKQLVMAVRQNHKLDRDLAKLDKRIALLIKNRTSLQDVIMASKGLKSQKKRQMTQMDPKKLEAYQDLFYLLQTEPRYLARCVYMINPKQLESFLETVILTLFGDSFSPREEFLLLSVFKQAIEREIAVVKSLADFIGGQSETVVPKMINSYNRRKQGVTYLQKTLRPVLEKVIKMDLNLELRPNEIYTGMINEYEMKTGEKSQLPRDISPEKIMENPDVKNTINSRLQSLTDVCQMFVDAIVKSIEELPYGLRWQCKMIRELCLKTLPDTTEEDIGKVIIYFVYYHFINLAIVTPDNYDVVDDLPLMARKTLMVVSKVLQHVFNFRKFGDEAKHMQPLNTYITSQEVLIREYIDKIIQVSNPEEMLQVNKYLELAQKAKPVILISLHELFRTHALIAENLDELAPETDDPLRVVMKDLGDPPSEFNEDDQDREIQLTLTNRFKMDVDEEQQNIQLYAETKELVIPILRLVPVQSSIHKLNLMDVLEAGIKYATETNNKTLSNQINQILENLGKLERDGMVTKDDQYESFVHDVALEVANRNVIRLQQKKEIQRLKGTLEELTTHQNYLDDSIKQYEQYLQDSKEKQYAIALKKGKKKGKKSDTGGYKIGPFKFSYKELAKKGVIVDSEVPVLSRKKTTFLISSEEPGVFEVVAKIAGMSVEKMILNLDDLLEKHYNNIHRLELEQVTLDVNMTIHLINKFFLK